MEERDEEKGLEYGYYSSFSVDMNKLSKFIQPVINYRQVKDGKTTFVS